MTNRGGAPVTLSMTDRLQIVAIALTVIIASVTASYWLQKDSAASAEASSKLATQITALEGQLKDEGSGLRREIDNLRGDLKGDIRELRQRVDQIVRPEKP